MQNPQPKQYTFVIIIIFRFQRASVEVLVLLTASSSHHRSHHVDPTTSSSQYQDRCVIAMVFVQTTAFKQFWSIKIEPQFCSSAINIIFLCCVRTLGFSTKVARINICISNVYRPTDRRTQLIALSHILVGRWLTKQMLSVTVVLPIWNMYLITLSGLHT